MPTYDYICGSCGHEFEAFESIKADPQKDCPKCDTTSLRRKIGPGAAILFKGSGFYSTDYGKGARKAAAKDGDSGAPSDKPAEKKETTTAADKPSGDKKASAD